MMEFYTCVNRKGRSIQYRGYRVEPDGSTVKRISKKVDFQPTLFVKSSLIPDLQDPVEVSKDNIFNTMRGEQVESFTFDDMFEAKEFVSKYEELDDFVIYGQQNYIAQFIWETFPTEIQFDATKLRIFYLDIEVDSSNGFPKPELAESQVTAISIYSTYHDTYYLWSYHDYDVSKSIIGPDKNLKYFKCDDEVMLLRSFLDFWDSAEYSPDIISGWNSRLFDVPYLINRIVRILSEKEAKRISPWKTFTYKEVAVKGKSMDVYDIHGIQQMDYYDLFQKFDRKYGQQESYRLDHIAHVVLNERKLSYEEYSSLDDLYQNDKQKFLDYNLRDTDLVKRLDDEMSLMSIALTLAYYGGVNYADTFGTTAIWDSIIYRHLMNQNIVVPPNVRHEKVPFVGGFVKDPYTGFFPHVASFDVNSLYPNLIVFYGISPETFLEDSIQSGVTIESCLDGTYPRNDLPNTSMAANGTRYDTSKDGIIPRIVLSLYDERRTVKAEMLKLKGDIEKTTSDKKKKELKSAVLKLSNREQAIKTLLNSLYGAFGNAYFRYFNLKMAEAITSSGQYAIRRMEGTLNRFMNEVLGTNDRDYVIAIDTDSIYIDMGALIDRFTPKDPVQFLSEICSTTFDRVIQNDFEAMGKEFSCYRQSLVMKRENIGSAIWVTKKRYIMDVFDSEGVRLNEPKLKVMGIEAVKSSTPTVCRVAMKELFKTIISGSESKTSDSMRQFEEHFMTLPPHEIAFPRGVSNIEKWTPTDGKDNSFMKGTPIHVRAALVHNRLIDELGLGRTHRKIMSGDKLKFAYLKMPNPTMENVIGFMNFLPVEFGLHSYVDTYKQFEKTFAAPLEPILNAVGWNTGDSESLDGFFV